MVRAAQVLASAAWLLGACQDQVVGQFSGTATSSISSDDGAHGSSSSSSGSDTIPEAERCDGIDNDHDGLVDEVAPNLSRCGECTLLQGQGQAWWVCDETLSWEAANARCEALGATSAIVPDAATQTFLLETVGEGWFWLGAQQAPNEGDWAWVNGAPLDYTNWGDTQPDNSAPSQDCVRLTFLIVDTDWFDGAWDDFACDEPLRVLCSAPHSEPPAGP